MSAGSPSFSPNEILDGLRPFRQRLRQLSIGRIVLLFLAAVVLVCFILLWFDTVWALPSIVRWASTRVALMAAGIGGAIFVYTRLRGITPEMVADQVDRTMNSGGEVLAGLQLATRPIHPSSELSTGLANLASKRAAAKLTDVSPQLVAPIEQLKKPALICLSCCGVVALVFAIVPSIAWHQIQRFLTPYGDVPPYTGILMELELESESVLYGQDSLVRAQVSGGRVARVHLVVQPDNGPELTLPMLAQNDSTYQAILTRITQPLSLYARSGASRSTLRRLDVTMTPQLLNPKVVITPPPYTRTSAYSGAVPEKGISGLVNTRVEWTAASNRPLSMGNLRVTYNDGEEELFKLGPIAGEDSEFKTVSGKMSLIKPGKFELRVVDVDGTESQDRLNGSIVISEDRRPVVRIIQPQPLSLATPDVQLPVVVLADDDYGISQLILYRSLNGSPALPTAAEFDRQARVQHQWQLSLPSYGLQPGDEIQLFARTEDNDPSGAKGAESPITLIKIISVAEFQELMVRQRGAEMLQAKYQAARRQLENIAAALREIQEAEEALQADPDSPEAADQLQETLEAAKQAAEQAASEINKLSQQAMPIDVDQELAKMLEVMSQQASEAAEQLEKMKQGAKPDLSDADEEGLEELIQQMAEMQQELTESAIDPLGKMQKTMPLMMDQQQFAQLAQQQRDLSERMKGLPAADANDPATQRRVAELESEQEQIKQQLEQLLAEIERHADELPLDEETQQLQETARQFAQAVRESMASREMGKAQNEMLGDKFDQAQSSSQKAAEILEGFLDDSQSMGDKACENCKASFKPSRASLGNSLQQMMAMMGMKPGQSGMKPGSNPGMSLGMGPGGGYSMRSPGPKNIGMYGSIPTPQQSPSRGRGDQQSQGVQTSQAIDSTSGGSATSENFVKGTAGGQDWNAVPANYRSKVADYFRTLSEKIGDVEEGFP